MFLECTLESFSNERKKMYKKTGAICRWNIIYLRRHPPSVCELVLSFKQFSNQQVKMVGLGGSMSSRPAVTRWSGVRELGNQAHRLMIQCTTPGGALDHLSEWTIETPLPHYVTRSHRSVSIHCDLNFGSRVNRYKTGDLWASNERVRTIWWTSGSC